MASTTTVPVTITPEAQARVNELNCQAEPARMIERVLETIPQILNVEVTAFIRYDEGGELGVLITGATTAPREQAMPAESELTRWKFETFPPDVAEHFFFSCVYEEAPHAG